MISHKAKYALRALVALARTGDSMMIGEIAAQERIPRKFLEQILLELKRHGIVMSTARQARGLCVADGRRPDHLRPGLAHPRRSAGALAVPQPDCVPALSDCRNEADCEIRHVFAEVANSAREVLDRTTIADAILRPESAQIEAIEAVR